MTRTRWTWVLVAALVAAVQAVMIADVLVLRDGRRIDGTLVGVRGDRVEFEHRDGRTRQYDRSDVRSIQFDDSDEGWRRNEDRYRDDAFGGGRPLAGLRERSVTVMGRARWTDSGIDVRNGQSLYFTASGEVRWGPGRRDDAAGERNSPFNGNRPMPDRPAAALIGKIGENGDPFFIGGTSQAIRVRGGGRLYLGLNDDFLEDNSGSLRVVIAY